jgi:tetratricopeptide (TPR) repeat protein
MTDLFEDFFKEQNSSKKKAELPIVNEIKLEENPSIQQSQTRPLKIGTKPPSAEFIKSQETNSTNPFFYTIRGMVYKQKGWFELAEKDFLTARKLNSNQNAAAHHLGMICFMKDDMDGAKKWCKISYDNLPKDGLNKYGLNKTSIQFTSIEDVVCYLGAIIVKMKDPEEALKHLKTETKNGNQRASELLQMLESEIENRKRNQKK